MSNTNIFNWWYNRVLVKQEPFTVQALKVTPLGAFTTFYIYNAGGNTPNLEYSYDGFTWIAAPTTSENAVTFREAFYLRGTNSAGISSSSSKYTTIMFTSGVKIEGDIRHLIEGSITPTGTEVPCDYCFFRLFASINDSNKCYVSDAFSMTMPYTTLKTSCYQAMFTGSTIITSMATLPASTLVSNCYDSMFYGCTSLTYSPTLPATTLASSCYSQMFYGCTSLTQAPSLPATNLTSAGACYSYMFYGCTSLTTPPSLPATTLSANCYQNMFDGCTRLASTPALPATSLTSRCYQQMFGNCTSLTTCGTLGWTAVDEYSCHYMFRNCTSLTTSPAIPLVFTLVSNCYTNMFNGCSQLNNVTASIAEWQSGGSYIYTSNWLDGVASTGTFNFNYKGSAPASRGASSVPTNWTIINEGSLYAGLSIRFSSSMTFSIQNYCTVSGSETTPNVDLWYATTDPENPESWTRFPVTQGSTTGSLSVAAKWYFFKGVNTQGWSKSEYKIIYSSTYSYIVSVMGNIMSIIDGDHFNDPDESLRLKTIPSVYCFSKLFYNWNSVTYFSVSLPATTLANYCYSQMFYGCERAQFASMTLPATSLKDYCYQSMFGNCKWLSNAPSLPATTLATYCYANMFSNCTNLTSIPSSLPATTLATFCYQYMFSGCTLLTTPPSLPATTLASSCYQYMFNGCTSITTPPSLSATTLATYCYAQMFQSCTSLTSAPSLPATTLFQSCYIAMFNGCTSLQALPALPATTLAPSCYQQMFMNCESITTIPSGYLPITTLTGSCYNQMFYGCRSLVNVPSDLLPATTLIGSCYQLMFSGCKSLVNVPSLSHITGTYPNRCFSGMFSGCTSLITPPSLPNLSISDYCFDSMFSGCTSLTSVPVLPNVNPIAKQFCYENMFKGCTSITTVPTDLLPMTTLEQGAYQGMFEGCTSLTNAPDLPARVTLNISYRYMFKGCVNLEGPINISAMLVTSKDNSTTEMFYKAGSARAKTASSVIHLSNEMAWWKTYSSAGIDLTCWDVDGYDYAYFYGYGSIYIENNGTNVPNLMYSLDYGTTWSEMPTSSGSAVSFNNTYMYLKGINPDGFSTSISNYSTIKDILASSHSLSLGGNITSLINGGVGITMSLEGKNYCFYKLCDGCSSLTASYLDLPSTTLSEGCYSYMFAHCGDFYRMPNLPATTLATACYSHMFDGTSITSRYNKLLPAPTLVNSCYSYMFANGTKTAGVITINATTEPSVDYTEAMFYNSGTLRSTTNPYITVADNYAAWNSANAGIDSNFWTVQCGTNYLGLKITSWYDSNSDNTVYINWRGTYQGTWTIKYSLNSGVTWNDYTIGGALNLKYGQMVCIKGIKDTTYSMSTSSYLKFTSYYQCNLSGDLTSLLNDGVGGVLDLTPYGDYLFYNMFNDFETYDAPILPSTTLTIGCYSNMFSYIDSLTQAPSLPATTVPKSAYYQMFKGSRKVTSTGIISASVIGETGCYEMFRETGLTVAPTLNLTDVGYRGCYWMFLNDYITDASNITISACSGGSSCCAMFSGCTKLTVLPNLPTTPSVPSACYYEMFINCTSLTTIPSGYLPAVTLASDCYNRMFYGCTSLVNVPSDLLPATTLADGCYEYMFSNCTSLVVAPTLPAPTLVSDCYYDMFWGCTSIAEIHCYAISGINYQSSTTNWFYRANTSGDFYCRESANWPLNSTSGIPAGWTRHNE